MSRPGSSSQNTPKITLKPGKPPLPVALVIKKDRSITIRGDDSAKLMKTLKLTPQTLKDIQFKEDTIYESRPDDFLKGNSPEKVIIVNTLDRLANVSRTVARYYSTSTNEILRELTSDNIIKLIGQNNYDTAFSALCSVINLESKVRGILSLLTENLCKQEKVVTPKSYEEKCCQTEENCMDLLFKLKNAKKRRIRRTQLNPYVVKDDPIKMQKRVVIHPYIETHRQMLQKVECKTENIESLSIDTDVKTTIQKYSKMVKQESQMNSLPDIKDLLNEDSNCSIGNLSALSNYSSDTLLKNPHELLKNVDRFTDTAHKIDMSKIETTDAERINKKNLYQLKLLDGSVIEVPCKPEDDFHIATPEILRYVSDEEQVKLRYYQAYIDWKYCLQKDSDGYMPIHVAVINDDVDMLRRQCFVLRSRHQSLDAVAAELTPLQMALLQDTPRCGDLVATLLRFGADALLTDSELRSPAHLAAEAPFEALKALLTHCEKQARSILQDHEELWKPEHATRSDADLSRTLLDHVCNAFDGQGYTPLMVASRLGLHRSVELLLEASPASVNTQTPNAGDTALYIAVGAACMHSIERGKKSKVAEHFKTSISALVAGGADAFLETLAGSSVNDLLNDNNIPELSLLIGNNITSMKFFNGKMPENAKCDAYMLENIAGKVTIAEVGNGKKSRKGKAHQGVKPGIVMNQKFKVNEKELIAEMLNDNVGDDKTVNNKDLKTKEKPIILENVEILKVDGTKHSKPVAINSKVKFINPQDKLDKKTSFATSDPVTNISISSGNVVIQNISKLEATSSKSVKQIIPKGEKKIVVINYSDSPIIDSSKLKSNTIIVSSTKTSVKRKATQDGPSAKKQGSILNPNVVIK